MQGLTSLHTEHKDDLPRQVGRTTSLSGPGYNHGYSLNGTFPGAKATPDADFFFCHVWIPVRIIGTCRTGERKTVNRTGIDTDPA
ncbi:MAG: hypothetical protein NT022_01920 [Deltaproteobacteria bacterium]|nr:hypothetical protein [Deltaproteobacteria bacterium]